MSRFSERIGVVAPRSVLQVGDMDEALRNSLWNWVLARFSAHTGGHSFAWSPLVRAVAVDFFKERLDLVPHARSHQALTWLHSRFDVLPWHAVYDLIEFIAHHVESLRRFESSSVVIAEANAILEREMAGYRFVLGELAPITNPEEVAAVSETDALASASGLIGVQTHIRSAVALLSQKPSPDFRNSIKESISAVESAAKRISGQDKASLKDALATLETKVDMHGALKAGFLSLYGYSSDAEGIRHALLEQPSLGFDEAKFMLISCSAFATFLMTKAAAAGIIHRD